MRAAMALVFLLSPALPAAAGQACEEHVVTPRQLDDGLALAAAVLERLPRHDARAVVLARVGADVSDQGLRWTHAGIAVRDEDTAIWRVLHKLNRCGAETSDLYRQGLGNFFLDDPHELRAWLLVPTAPVQRQVLRALERGADLALHEPRYSMIAYPFETEFQNSNQWLLELVAVATDPIGGMTRASAQRRLQRTGYRPGLITVPPSKRVAARLFRANVSFADHPWSERLRHRYGTVTVESIEAYLRRNAWLAAAEEIRLPEARDAGR